MNRFEPFHCASINPIFLITPSNQFFINTEQFLVLYYSNHHLGNIGRVESLSNVNVQYVIVGHG